MADEELFGDELHLAVAVHVANGGVVGLILVGDVGLSVVRDALGLLHLQPFVGQAEALLAVGRRLSGVHRLHGVLALERAVGVGEVGNGERLVVDLHTVAVEIVGGGVILVGVDAPRAVHAAIALHGDETSVEVVKLALGEACQRTHGHQECGCDDSFVHICVACFLFSVKR